MQLCQYQHQSTPVPSTGIVCHCAETWTLLAAEMKTLQAFHIRCQQQIVDIRWWAHISNAEVLLRSGLSAIGDILRHRFISVWPCCTSGSWSSST